MEAYTGYIWVLWDIGAVLVLALFIWGSAMRGFVRTLISLGGYVAALAAARFASPMLAKGLYEHFVRDVLRVVLMGRLEEMVAEGGAAAADVVEQIPASLRRIMTGDALAAADSALNTEASGMVDSLIDAALRDPVMSILEGLLFLLVFTLASLAARYIARLFSGFHRLPVLGAVDTVLGGIVGVGQACLALVVISLLLQLTILFTGGYFWLSDSVMQDTYILRVFYNLLRL